VIKDPTGASQETIEMTVSGDTLTMKSGDQTETLTRSTGEAQPPASPPASTSPAPSAS
jgi:hypothetical protein